MVRRLAVAGAAIVTLLAVAVGAIAYMLSSSDDIAFGAGPTSAKFVDSEVGVVDPKTLDLLGDVLLTSRHTLGLQARPLDDPSRTPVTLFGATFTKVVQNRYAVAWTGNAWQIVRLSDLHVVAEVQGADPLFLDTDTILVVFNGDDCGRRNATILDLRTRTQHSLRLSGDRARLVPVAVDGTRVIVQRQKRGDSSCATAGFGTLDLDTGVVRTVAEAGNVTAVADGHVWVTQWDRTDVHDPSGRVVASKPVRMAAVSVNDGVVYAETPVPRAASAGPSPATRLKLGSATGPSAEDAEGDELIEPEDMTSVLDGSALVVAHRGAALPDGGHATVMSLCTVPDLRCRELADVTGDYPRVVGIVPATAFGA